MSMTFQQPYQTHEQLASLYRAGSGQIPPDQASSTSSSTSVTGVVPTTAPGSITSMQQQQQQQHDFAQQYYAELAQQNQPILQNTSAPANATQILSHQHLQNQHHQNPQQQEDLLSSYYAQQPNYASYGEPAGVAAPQLYQPQRHQTSYPSRTVYLGNIPGDIEPHELLNHVRSGTVEALKIVPAKNCAFISFLDENSAMLFHSDAILKRLSIHNHEVKVGWGKPTPVQPIVASCVARYNATRNVYLGNLDETVTEAELAHDLAEFGAIDTIKVLADKKIAFVHFTSILSAIRCIQSLPLADKYRDRKVFYGKDRCAFITKTQQHNAAQYLGLNPNAENLLNQVDRDLIANALVRQSNAAAVIATSAGGSGNLGNRTIYLGNLHPDSTIEEICNVARGGILQNIRLISERHVCFITFIDPISAAQFYAMSSLHGLIIHNRKIKVGWGKHSGPLPNSINLAVGNGASRNIYIGGLDKIPEIKFTKEKLYNDFREFGETEQINFYDERHCCFVNFTNISNAIKAIDGIRNNEDYRKCKINFGKDRCGNMPRQFQQPGSGQHHLQGQIVGDVNGQQFYDYSEGEGEGESDSDSESDSNSGVFEPYGNANPMGIIIDNSERGE